MRSAQSGRGHRQLRLLHVRPAIGRPSLGRHQHRRRDLADRGAGGEPAGRQQPAWPRALRRLPPAGTSGNRSGTVRIGLHGSVSSPTREQTRSSIRSTSRATRIQHRCSSPSGRAAATGARTPPTFGDSGTQPLGRTGHCRANRSVLVRPPGAGADEPGPAARSGSADDRTAERQLCGQRQQRRSDRGHR